MVSEMFLVTVEVHQYAGDRGLDGGKDARTESLADAAGHMHAGGDLKGEGGIVADASGIADTAG
jgi:hypothetical protein